MKKTPLQTGGGHLALPPCWDMAGVYLHLKTFGPKGHKAPPPRDTLRAPGRSTSLGLLRRGGGWPQLTRALR